MFKIPASILAAVLFGLSLAQGSGTSTDTAFTYQGRLSQSGAPATGTFDFQFSIYDSATNGALKAGPLPLPTQVVSSGIFLARLDFGNPALFNGEARWLEIAVRTNGLGGYTTLQPRQQLTAAPYAQYALNAGTVSSTGLVSALQPSGIVTNGQAGVSFVGTFTGSGSGLTNLLIPGLAFSNSIVRDLETLIVSQAGTTAANGIYHHDPAADNASYAYTNKNFVILYDLGEFSGAFSYTLGSNTTALYLGGADPTDPWHVASGSSPAPVAVYGLLTNIITLGRFAGDAGSLANLNGGAIQPGTIGTNQLDAAARDLAPWFNDNHFNGAYMTNGPPPPYSLASRAPVPWLGWNSWSSLEAGVNATAITNIVNTWKTNGMLAAGYDLIWVDDGWMAGARDTSGNLTEDPIKFPGGMKALIDYVHASGFRFGIYVSMGTVTCAGLPGSLGHEFQDTLRFAYWGVDALKVDECGVGNLPFWSSYLQVEPDLISIWVNAVSFPNISRPIILVATEFNIFPWTPERLNAWQNPQATVVGSFPGLLNGISQMTNGQWTGPYPDQPGQIGPGHYKESIGFYVNATPPAVLRSTLSMMSIFVDGILLDETPNTTSFPLVTNPQFLSILRDPACIRGDLKANYGPVQIWLRPLGWARDRFAIVLLNTGSSPANVTVNFPSLGLPQLYNALDVWSGATVANSASSLNASVAGQDSRQFLLTPTFGNGITTNLSVLLPGNQPATLSFSNGILMQVK